jgi:hypothetical protein
MFLGFKRFSAQAVPRIPTLPISPTVSMISKVLSTPMVPMIPMVLIIPTLPMIPTIPMIPTVPMISTLAGFPRVSWCTYFTNLSCCVQCVQWRENGKASLEPLTWEIHL